MLPGRHQTQPQKLLLFSLSCACCCQFSQISTLPFQRLLQLLCLKLPVIQRTLYGNLKICDFFSLRQQILIQSLDAGFYSVFYVFYSLLYGISLRMASWYGWTMCYIAKIFAFFN